MKKILSVISVSLFIWGCSSSNIVSENAVKQALEIAYSQTAPMSWEDFGAPKIISKTAISAKKLHV